MLMLDLSSARKLAICWSASRRSYSRGNPLPAKS